MKSTEEKAKTFQDRPLAFRMRPTHIADFIGQEHLLGKDRMLRKMIDSEHFLSSIFYGPPGCGKTALANIIINSLNARNEKINAVNSSVSQIRDIISRARTYLDHGQRTLLLIDEFHRFNRSQQESLLPDVEEGTLTLIGLTTENPYYFISGPLISRTTVFNFEHLSVEDINNILRNAAFDKERGLGICGISFAEDALDLISSSADGDARYALNMLEMASLTASVDHVDADYMKTIISSRKFHYDRKGDQHYDTISAFIKSMRGSDPDAALYYLAKMLATGEDPRFIARRMAIAASEDVGNADPRAFIMANSALNAVEYIGMPEARIVLAQVATYIACSPKSNASYSAIGKAEKYIADKGACEVPAHLTKRGASSYKYPHDYQHGYVRQDYMTGKASFYEPVDRGHEKYIRKYLDFIRSRK